MNKVQIILESKSISVSSIGTFCYRRVVVIITSALLFNFSPIAAADEPVSWNAMNMNMSSIPLSDAIQAIKIFSRISNSVPSFEAKLMHTVRTAQSADSFVFTDAGSLGPNRTADAANKRAGKRLSTAARKRLGWMIVSAGTYATDFGLQQACPFVPTVGFQLRAGTQEAWWLVSKDCNMAVLARGDEDWRRTIVANVTPAAVELFVRLAGK